MRPVQRWSRQPRTVFILMLLGSVVLHGAGFYLVSVSDGASPSGWQNRPRVHLMQPNLEPGDGRPYLYRLADLMDPSLMSLPSVQGFSRDAWARAFTVRLEPVAWDSPPSFLAMTPRSADRVLLARPALPDSLQQDVVKKRIHPRPVVPLEADAALSAPSPPGNRSVMLLAGDLAGLVMTDQPPLPVVSHLGGLRPTVIRLGVGWEGMVRYATLEQGSGDSAADAQALQLARQIRFARQSRSGSAPLAWGRAAFHWATVPPDAEGEPAPTTEPQVEPAS